MPDGVTKEGRSFRIGIPTEYFLIRAQDDNPPKGPISVDDESHYRTYEALPYLSGFGLRFDLSTFDLLSRRP